MRVARLLLCYVLLEDYSTNLGGAAITSDAARQDASATNPTLPDLPSFVQPIGNVTAAIGKEAVLPCTIRKLGNHKVGWIRVEDKTILSMGQRTVTHSPRFLVTLENAKSKNQSQSRDEEEATSRLHIRQLREADRGCYMCQLNTKPMLSQLGCVDVLVPPDILSTGTSEGEVSVLEGENATLSCKASGRPTPRVLWRREKSGFILMRGLHDPLIPDFIVDNQSGEKLELTRVDRRQMGAYLCIAKNEVPPAVSKRVYLRVNFPPSAKVPNQLLSSPLDTDVSLICLIEAYPKTINLWTRKEQVIMSGGRYEIDERGHPDEEWKTTSELKIRRLEKTDLGEYTCSASSSMGKAEATLRVYEIERATPPTRTTLANSNKSSNRGKSKFAQVTTINRIFHQMSTPAMQKSTARIVYSKHMTTSTTVDPRAPFIKDKNLFKNRDTPNVRNCANAKKLGGTRIYAVCLLFFLTLR
ncbi:lachesin-like isoform X1 [Bombus pascuorum]|uniref:lachesin-like isoform X1 n=1 Tax=Bombus pascuorum TaxID=65598 RepID=UPI0021405522|nr:lachesin-like isoform X1 [Bombus pascuorum]XP_060817592.1 lachesin-like isoform X1 [Bombus pascuorum]XP_060817593.1 lachesin-like isoform X1 [Bombus pascuorum]